MMPPSDELRELWQSDSGNGGAGQKTLLLQLEQRARRFHRTIWLRDLREIVAGAVVAVIYLWFAIRAGSILERVSDWWLAACGLWIILYLRLYSKASRNPEPEQSLSGYRRSLCERYDRQIGLLKNAGYWYVLPFWAGLMMNACAYLAAGEWIPFGVIAGIATAMAAGVWWLNRVAGVRHLERQRQELAALIRQEGE